MKTESFCIPVMTLDEFADKYGLVMEIHERNREVGDPGLFYAHFKRCEVMQNGCLAGVSGNGPTPKDALADYAQRLSLTRIAVNAMSEERQEIQVPRLKISEPSKAANANPLSQIRRNPPPTGKERER